ncbi:hypothetical protein SUGI_0947610 [Cryptomeria japonica]|nr:hypothetical protein SUGI_0947610 [Cryptomeria japonica]
MRRSSRPLPLRRSVCFLQWYSASFVEHGRIPSQGLSGGCMQYQNRCMAGNKSPTPYINHQGYSWAYDRAKVSMVKRSGVSKFLSRRTVASVTSINMATICWIAVVLVKRQWCNDCWASLLLRQWKESVK